MKRGDINCQKLLKIGQKLSKKRKKKGGYMNCQNYQKGRYHLKKNRHIISILLPPSTLLMKRGNKQGKKLSEGDSEIAKSYEKGRHKLSKTIKNGSGMVKTTKGGTHGEIRIEKNTIDTLSIHCLLLLTYLFPPVQKLRRLEWQFAWCPSISRP